MSAQGWTAVPHSVARSATLSVNAKVVYLAIASRANAEGRAWPGWKLISEDTGLARATVHRALAELREAALVTWEQTLSADGKACGVNTYTVQGGLSRRRGESHTETGVSQVETGGVSQGDEGESHTETPRRTSRRTPKKNTDAHAHSAHFDAFWQAYPIKVGKGRARLAYDKALKTTDPATLLVAVERFAAETAATERRFIPHPTTWLNAERWTDEPPEAPRPAGSSIWDKPIRPYEEDIA